MGHIHRVVRSEPKISPSDVMQIIKSISARAFFRLNPEIKRQFFGMGSYGLKAILWERLEMLAKRHIRKYAQEQLKVMDKGEEPSSQPGCLRLSCLSYRTEEL